MQSIHGGKSNINIGENIGIGKSTESRVVKSVAIPPPDVPPPVIAYDLIFSHAQNSVYTVLF